MIKALKKLRTKIKYPTRRVSITDLSLGNIMLSRTGLRKRFL